VLAGRIAVFAPVEGEYYQINGGCHPSRPATVLEVPVRTDPAAPYAGMPARGSPDYFATPVPVWLGQWAARDRCQSQAQTSKMPFVMTQWTGCASGAGVAGWVFASGGHSWFGYTGVAPGTRMLLDFFRAHALRPAPPAWTAGPAASIPAVGQAQLRVRSLRIFPTPGAEPFDIARGADGDMWFTEFAADKIGRITPAGAITEYPVPTPGVGPFTLAPGPENAMWFTEQDGIVGRVTSAGEVAELALPQAGSNPDGIATGPGHTIWVTETGAGAIAEITTTP